ncbi:MAG: hypothetical protein DRP81_02710 [Candidatus Omnitrophota bacterium]|nr:MAG: hypothetical protein DRP72_00450 [Candidatus Omnitrophota bacterium]RKY45823.1 MAG: hypothetical protein DRP81_02710 [Candidatus Omnitrophota bacterium]HDN85816.1 SPOR domain-containing protein [Candidatus Omnitrophota bacterium]
MKGEQLKFFDFQENKRRKLSFSISLDTLIIFLIIVSFAIVFSYILGVERGKKLSPFGEERESQALILKPTKSVHEDTQNVRESLKKSERVSRRENKKKEILSGKYVIQVATYKNRRIAEKEKKRLEEEGYPVIVSQKGDYLVIFVGKYSTQEEARRHLRYLKNRYKDCFIRKL